MVIGDNSVQQINTALLILQRRIERITQAMENFTTNLNKCTTVEEIAALKLSISTNVKED